MISERRLAKSFNSLWRQTTPTMEMFVKRCNLDLYVRNFEPITSVVPPDRRALVNVVGYEAFHILRTKIDGLPIFARASADTLPNVAHLLSDDAFMQTVIAAAGATQASMTPEELSEAAELGRRMWLQFRVPTRRVVITKPTFKGCGVLMSCTGDALVENSTICEMKDGDRPFRAYEFRQLVLYAALFFNQNGNPPSHLEVVNSRRGTSVLVAMEDFAQQVAGETAQSLLYEVVRTLSDVTISQ